MTGREQPNMREQQDGSAVKNSYPERKQPLEPRRLFPAATVERAACSGRCACTRCGVVRCASYNGDVYGTRCGTLPYPLRGRSTTVPYSRTRVLQSRTPGLEYYSPMS